MSTTARTNTKKITEGLFSKKDQAGKYARHTPCANIEARKEEYVITIAAPGFSREDFEITIKEKWISVNVQKGRLAIDRSSSKVNYEYDFSKWKRDFQLPFDADSSFTHAFYLNGELKVHIPRSNAPLSTSDTKIGVY